MSDTPKTDAACGWPWGHHGRIESSDLKLSPDGPFVHSSVARELERENAALRRDVYQCPPTSENDYEGFKWNDACEELERENAALRADKERLANAAKEVLASYILTMRVELGHPCPENLVICRDLRAAIDAARKEAQP